MDVVGGFFLVLALLVLVGVVVWAIVAEAGRVKEGFAAAQARYGGHIEESFWKGKSLHFQVDGVRGKLSYFSGTDKAPPWTKVQFDWAPPYRLRVAPEGTWASLKKFFGAQDIQIGHALFDQAFLIQGEPESWVREVLVRENRERLFKLRELGASFWRGKGISLDVTPAGIIVHCYRNHVRAPENLLVYLEESIALLRALKAASGVGVSVSVREVVKAGKCPVCGEVPEGRPRRCGTCDTAYHSECWSYLGGCAIFGCSEQYRSGAPKERLKEW